MKLILIFTISLFCLQGWAQEWQNVNQDYFGMKYKLPDGWEVDGFGGDDWEETGSSVCDCAGTINIGNRYSDKEIYMVVYPSRNKDSIQNLKRQLVWDMEFQYIDKWEPVKTKYCTFKKKISKWNDKAAGSFAGNEVWQLQTNYKNQYYVIYFWAKPEVMREYETILKQIIDSFKPVKGK